MPFSWPAVMSITSTGGIAPLPASACMRPVSPSTRDGIAFQPRQIGVGIRGAGDIMLVLEQIGQVRISGAELGDDIGRAAIADIGIEHGVGADRHGAPSLLGQGIGSLGSIEIERGGRRQPGAAELAKLTEPGGAPVGARRSPAALRSMKRPCSAARSPRSMPSERAYSGSRREGPQPARRARPAPWRRLDWGPDWRPPALWPRREAPL